MDAAARCSLRTILLLHIRIDTSAVYVHPDMRIISSKREKHISPDGGRDPVRDGYGFVFFYTLRKSESVQVHIGIVFSAERHIPSL